MRPLLKNSLEILKKAEGDPDPLKTLIVQLSGKELDELRTITLADLLAEITIGDVLEAATQ